MTRVDDRTVPGHFTGVLWEELNVDLSTIIGLVLGAACIGVALVLGGTMSAYVDPMSLLIVLGGRRRNPDVSAADPIPLVASNQSQDHFPSAATGDRAGRHAGRSG